MMKPLIDALGSLRRVLGASLAAAGALLAGCSPLAALNGLSADDGYARVVTASYGSDPRQTLDVYVPRHPANGKVVVFFYGGSWNSGSRADYRFVAQTLSRHGATVVIADYRLYPEVVFPAFVEDAAAAVAWTFSHIAEHGGDPADISLVGHSAGAHLVALLALDDRYLGAHGLRPGQLARVVGLSTPADFAQTLGARWRPVFVDQATLDRAQPVRYANADAPPMLLLHGADDTLVGPSNSLTLAERVRAAGGEAQVRVYPDTGHPATVLAFAPLLGNPTILDDMLRFLELGPAAAASEATMADAAAPQP